MLSLSDAIVLDGLAAGARPVEHELDKDDGVGDEGTETANDPGPAASEVRWLEGVHEKTEPVRRVARRREQEEEEREALYQMSEQHARDGGKVEWRSGSLRQETGGENASSLACCIWGSTAGGILGRVGIAAYAAAVRAKRNMQ